jgi:hypothetical protein
MFPRGISLFLFIGRFQIGPVAACYNLRNPANLKTTLRQGQRIEPPIAAAAAVVGMVAEPPIALVAADRRRHRGHRLPSH